MRYPTTRYLPRSQRLRADLEHGRGATQRLPRARDHRPALLGVLSAEPDQRKLARSRAAGCARKRQLRGRRLAGAQGWQHILGERRHHARSEEHTSELQSLMRISYAVFCLKKKKKTPHYTNSKPHQIENTKAR